MRSRPLLGFVVMPILQPVISMARLAIFPERSLGGLKGSSSNSAGSCFGSCCTMSLLQLRSDPRSILICRCSSTFIVNVDCSALALPVHSCVCSCCCGNVDGCSTNCSRRQPLPTSLLTALGVVFPTACPSRESPVGRLFLLIPTPRALFLLWLL